MMRLELTRVHARWLDVTLICPNQKFTIAVSHLSDAVRDLIDSVASLRTCKSANCSWLQEPGEVFLVFRRLNGEVELELTTLEGSGMAAGLPSEGIELFKGRTSVKTLARQLRSSVLALTQSMGAEGYEREWGYAIPQDALNKLDELIASIK